MQNIELRIKIKVHQPLLICLHLPNILINSAQSNHPHKINLVSTTVGPSLQLGVNSH